MPNSTGLLKEVFSILEKVQSAFMLTEIQRKEIIDDVFHAVTETESFFGTCTPSREIIRNEKLANVWSKAGQTLMKNIPNEPIGIWLQNKGEAWANPSKWSRETMQENQLAIEDIKPRILEITNNRIHILRRKNI